MKKQTTQGWQLLLATIAIVLTFSTPAATVAQEKKSVGERYASREPYKCEDQTAPAKGSITAALAKQYVTCNGERVVSEYLYLLENVKVQVGAGRPFNPRSDTYSNIDACSPVYPIRGSYTQY